MKNLIIYLILAFTVAGCGKQAESIASKTNWTLVAQGEGNKTRWYIDFDSMNIKSPGIFSYKELYDSDEPFEAIRNDGRKVKSIMEEKLVNCTDGTTKGGVFTAFSQNMANGPSFTGESKLSMWMGSVPGTPSRKMVIALCQPETRQSNGIAKQNLQEVVFQDGEYSDGIATLSITTSGNTKIAEFTNPRLHAAGFIWVEGKLRISSKGALLSDDKGECELSVSTVANDDKSVEVDVKKGCADWTDGWILTRK